ncbi:hypothetical protein N658DRAFT_285117 [Parathielavia hyrcaniae]|uniref:Uncharacterized protein n=1 Tax=Parathielavia hyrcaniae TaxID=113614 RepID=A0AAN6Q534_9PEZI|nr:hypothetical protein N658DRAFT_285117 [Parathielavia hyrcaniae]
MQDPQGFPAWPFIPWFSWSHACTAVKKRKSGPLVLLKVSESSLFCTCIRDTNYYSVLRSWFLSSMADAITTRRSYRQSGSLGDGRDRNRGAMASRGSQRGESALAAQWSPPTCDSTIAGVGRCGARNRPGPVAWKRSTEVARQERGSLGRNDSSRTAWQGQGAVDVEKVRAAACQGG